MQRHIWPWGFVPLREKEYKELKENSDKWKIFRESLREHNCHYTCICVQLIDSENKLATVKVWHKAQLGCQVDPTDIRELGGILGIEEEITVKCNIPKSKYYKKYCVKQKCNLYVCSQVWDTVRTPEEVVHNGEQVK